MRFRCDNPGGRGKGAGIFDKVGTCKIHVQIPFKLIHKFIDNVSPTLIKFEEYLKKDRVSFRFI